MFFIDKEGNKKNTIVKVKVYLTLKNETEKRCNVTKKNARGMRGYMGTREEERGGMKTEENWSRYIYKMFTIYRLSLRFHADRQYNTV